MNKAERLAQDNAVSPVLFYRPLSPWGCFSNFSHHAVILPSPWTLELVEYQTSEHRYQAMKAINQADHDFITASDSPFESKMRGGPTGIDLREDWGNAKGDVCWLVMNEVILAKVMQHSVVMKALIATGDRVLYEDSPTDDIWGWRCGADYRGKNLLGLSLMYVRALAISEVFRLA